MGEQHPLNRASIDFAARRTSPGVYLLYRSREGPVRYVGRSDTDVNGRLKEHVGAGYSYFRMEYASSPKAAFERECNLYHHYGGANGGLDNSRHPQRPLNRAWRCPRCSIFD